MNRTLSAGLLGLALLAAPELLRARDPLDDARSRLKIEAERVEREFTDGRAAAYRLVRQARPRLSDALDKLDALLAMLKDDRSLDENRRERLIKTIKFDQGKVRDEAEEHRVRAAKEERIASRPPRPPARPVYTAKETNGSIRDYIDSRKKILASSKGFRTEKELGRLSAYVEVEKSARFVADDISFPKNWKELSARRSDAIKLTETERSILKALGTVIEVDYDRMNLQDVLDDLRKRTGIVIAADKKAIEDAGATYDTPVTLKTRLSLRSILKKINSDLGLAYVIKDESVLITSKERASKMTVTKTYYLGDMVAVTGLAMDPITSQLVMAERVNMIINMIVRNVDPQSWRANNPDAVGSITFNPINMSLIITQTAEFHFMNFGSRR